MGWTYRRIIEVTNYHFVAVAASKSVVRLVDAFPLSWRLLGSPLDERSKSYVIVPFVHS